MEYCTGNPKKIYKKEKGNYVNNFFLRKPGGLLEVWKSNKIHYLNYHCGNLKLDRK